MAKKYELKSYKKEALEAAEDLGYSAEVIARINACDNDLEIDRIMRQARSEMADEEAEARR